MSIFLNGSAKSCLCLLSEGVCFVKEDDFKGGSYRCGASEILDFSADDADTSFVTGVEFMEVL